MLQTCKEEFRGVAQRTQTRIKRSGGKSLKLLKIFQKSCRLTYSQNSDRRRLMLKFFSFYFLQGSLGVRLSPAGGWVAGNEASGRNAGNDQERNRTDLRLQGYSVRNKNGRSGPRRLRHPVYT